METAKHQARQAQEEIRGLKARLARALGEEVAADHQQHSGSSATLTALRVQVEHLLGAEVDPRQRLRDTDVLAASQ